ncbi:MAG: GTPase HflX [Desulfobacterales bacterium]|nr:GTPase HflX [Desulfobacterales bacterium]
MKRIFGNTTGLKSDQIRRLENLYRRRIPPEYLVTPELARDVSRLSHEIRRQIGLLIDRSGKITHVIAGNHQGIIIPETKEYRAAPDRLNGLRCVHTHLHHEPLTRDDLADLSLLRLDLMAAITVKEDGLPGQIHAGHILPKSSDLHPVQILEPLHPNQLDIGCLHLINDLETELAHLRPLYAADKRREQAFLVSVARSRAHTTVSSLTELKALARSSGIHVIGTLVQQRSKVVSSFLIGSGKLKELTVLALQKGATLIVFDQELSPSQIRAISDKIDLKIIDRTQLILDIFAQRAQTREGKLQVELAQLKYLLPRLVLKNTAMSRLTGGIGGRGPGETKLEINRRRVRERIVRLEKSLSEVRMRRKHQKAKRHKRGLPVISIVGYTNAGKSTLLNTLTKSDVLAESRLFATLDPASRRLKFPKDIEVIITDTVGFIKDLPKDLMVAFRATLEELESADILLHVIDISNPDFNAQREAVERILSDLNLQNIPIIRVLNKQDRVEKERIDQLRDQLGGFPVCAQDAPSLAGLIEKLQTMIAVSPENFPPNRRQEENLLTYLNKSR